MIWRTCPVEAPPRNYAKSLMTAIWATSMPALATPYLMYGDLAGTAAGGQAAQVTVIIDDCLDEFGTTRVITRGYAINAARAATLYLM